MCPESTRDFEANKILGGVGALLAAIGSLVLFSGAVGIVCIVGLILVLISLMGLASSFKEHSIYRNALNGFIFGVIGIVLSVIVFASFTLLSGFVFVHPLAGDLGIVLAIAGWIVLFVFLLLSGIFYKQSFDTLVAESLKVCLGQANLSS